MIMIISFTCLEKWPFAAGKEMVLISLIDLSNTETRLEMSTLTLIKTLLK